MRLLYILSIAFISCNGTSTKEHSIAAHDSIIEIKETGDQKETGDNTEKPGTGGTGDCYWQILKRDTLVASLSLTGNIVTGKLSFDNFEKDGSSGMVTGKSENGVMKLWYSFESEGMKSVMEVWLKKQGDVLMRGKGEMNVKSDTAYFMNPKEVDFTSNQQMKKIDCSDVPSKYRH